MALAFVTQTALFGSRPIVSLHAEALGAEPLFVGVLASVYGLSGLAFTVPVGNWIDRWGGFTMARWGAVLAIGGLLLTAAPNVYAISAAQVLTGIAFTFAALGSQASTAAMGTAAEHTRNYAIYSTVVSAAHLLGPMLFGFVSDAAGYALAFVCAAAICLLGACLPQPPGLGAAPAAQRATTHSITGLLANRSLVLAIIIGMVVLLTQDVLVSFFPLYASALGLSAGVTGLILSGRSLAQLIVRPFLGYAVNRWGRPRLLFFCMLTGGVCIAAMGWLESALGLALASLSLGLTIGLAQPSTMAMVAEVAPRDALGLALSLRMAGTRLGQALGPVLLGFVAGPLGPAVALWVSGGMLSVSAYLATAQARSAGAAGAADAADADGAAGAADTADAAGEAERAHSAR